VNDNNPTDSFRTFLETVHADDPTGPRAELDPQRGFWGTVILTGAWPAPDGNFAGGFYGFIQVLPAELSGMKPARGDTPWLCRVAGDNTDIIVPGCKVALFYAGPYLEEAAHEREEGKGFRTWRVQ
jgi:hypothetical protein